jgi:hypothetical protein
MNRIRLMKQDFRVKVHRPTKGWLFGLHSNHLFFYMYGQWLANMLMYLPMKNVLCVSICKFYNKCDSMMTEIVDWWIKLCLCMHVHTLINNCSQSFQSAYSCTCRQFKPRVLRYFCCMFDFYNCGSLWWYQVSSPVAQLANYCITWSPVIFLN